MQISQAQGATTATGIGISRGLFDYAQVRESEGVWGAEHRQCALLAGRGQVIVFGWKGRESAAGTPAQWFVWTRAWASHTVTVHPHLSQVHESVCREGSFET
jgi:hypothetical protein